MLQFPFQLVTMIHGIAQRSVVHLSSLSIVSLLYFFVALNAVGGSIYLLAKSPKVLENKLFVVVAASVALWGVGLGMAGLAPNVKAGEVWIRIAALGWGTFYANLLHLTLVFTKRTAWIRKRFHLVLLYIPALLMILANSLTLFFHKDAYFLIRTAYSLVNAAGRSFWDWLFYCYFLSYMGLTLVLLHRYQKSLGQQSKIKRIKVLLHSLLNFLFVGLGIDVILHSFVPSLPYVAPLFLFNPMRYLLELLYEKNSEDSQDTFTRSNFLFITLGVLVYLLISFLLVRLVGDWQLLNRLTVSEATYRGIITQLQMVISLVFILKAGPLGFFVALVLNFLNLVSSVLFFASNWYRFFHSRYHLLHRRHHVACPGQRVFGS